MRHSRRRRSRRRQNRKRKSRRQRGGARQSIPISEWNGAPIVDDCATLVYRPTDPTDRHGSPYALVRLCDVVGDEGQFATAT